MYHRFRDRTHAGQTLAALLPSYAGRDDVLVLALPRGGVPVAREIARALNAPLDLMVVRKLGMPGQPELAMGAIGPGGVRVLNPRVAHFVPKDMIERVAERELAEVERRLYAYRGERPLPRLQGRRVILVDDGLATGATMRAAIATTRAREPAEIVVAVPVAPGETVDTLRSEADVVICPSTPEPFFSISPWYDDFTQVSDQEVVDLLQSVWYGETSARPQA